MNKAIKVYLWLIAFFPLIFDRNLAFFSSSTEKALFVRGFIFLAGFTFLFLFFYKKSFRYEIFEKIKRYIKNPILISLLVFLLFYIISTIFAIDKYSAFWGNLERGEGLVGLIYLVLFFLFSLLIFEKKDWLLFYKISLFVTSILVLKELIQFSGGLGRPSSFFGNPTFLAGYFLFSIFCSLIVLNEEKNIVWKLFSITSIIFSILGIFITETRGTIVGLAVGFFIAFIYGIIKGADIYYKKINLRTISIILFFVFFIFLAFFISTKNNEIWHKIPGFSRVADISNLDNTTQTRFLMAKLSINAIDPIQNGLKKFVVGWGPENFSLAYGKYFNPKQFSFELSWFDRAHNKFLDLLVMTGIFGLVSYCIIWISIFVKIFIKRKYSLVNVAILIFSVSYLTHLAFIFDHISTSIPFFIFLSYVIYFSEYGDERVINIKNKKFFEILISIILTGVIFFSGFLFIRNDFIGYIQMRKYNNLINKNDTKLVVNKINTVFSPFTTAQFNIREHFLLFVDEYYRGDSDNLRRLSDISIVRGQELVKKNPYRNKLLLILSNIYLNKSQKLNDTNIIIAGEKYFYKVLELSPNRSDFNYNLALNLFVQKKYDESFIYFEKSADLNGGMFIKESEKIYENLFKHFFETKNKQDFIRTAKRLKENNYANSNVLDSIIDYINKNNKWPKIDFEYY
jgi:O-antigen ligase